MLQREIDDHKKEEKCLTKTIKEKDREAVKIKNKCDNLEANVKRLKSDVTVLRNENKQAGAELGQAQLKLVLDFILIFHRFGFS